MRMRMGMGMGKGMGMGIGMRMGMRIVSQISVPSEFLSFKSHVERCQPV